MLKMPLAALRAIEEGVKPVFKVIVYWQEPETYTEEDHLISVGDLSTSMSDGRYEIANTAVTLKNKEYYFSRRLARELPNNKLVEVYMTLAGEDILVFRGIAGKDWTLSELTLTLNINA